LPNSGAIQLSMTVTSVLGRSTSNRLIIQRLIHQPQRPSCCSIKTAIPPSRPAPVHAVARSGGPGCPQGIAVGDASRPARPRARRHSHRRDGRLCPTPDTSPSDHGWINLRRLDADSHRRQQCAVRAEQDKNLTRLTHDLSRIIDNADRCLFQRHVQPGKVTHGCFSSRFVVDALGPRFIIPRGAATGSPGGDPNHPICQESTAPSE
jgi:hypothetical protein